MILSYQTIKRLCTEVQLIEPWSERTVISGMSYGLAAASYDFRIAQNLIMPPHSFMLCSTKEKVNMPNNICAFVCDKSTWARRGIAVQNTYFDPGFIGYPTIELTNHTNHIVTIVEGDPICQFVFMFLDAPTEKPYQGKYQHQKAEPVEAKNES